MAKKYIIHENKFIKGNVRYHFELVPNNNRTRPEGGGFWHIDIEKNIFFLYGSSTDFGVVTKDRIIEVLKSNFMETRLEGFEVYHSYTTTVDFLDPDIYSLDNWIHIHTIKNSEVTEILANDNRVQTKRESFGSPDVADLNDSYVNHKEAARMQEQANTLRALHDGPARKVKGKIVKVRTEPKIQRNEPCPCGSGSKYKKCCGKK